MTHTVRVEKKKTGPKPKDEELKSVFKGFTFDPKVWVEFEEWTTSGERSALMNEAAARIVAARKRKGERPPGAGPNPPRKPKGDPDA